MERSIIHINITDFAAAVEQVVDSSLRERPVIIAPQAARALVYDMSEEAYRQGIRKGMSLVRARRRCRDAVQLIPRPGLYTRAMAALQKEMRPYSPLIEQAEGDGHFFVDVSGSSRLLGPSADVARRIRKQVAGGLGLRPIWTVAPNKLVAKVASRLVKPQGEHIVKDGDEAAFLAPLPVSILPGLLFREKERLKEFQLHQAGQVAALTPAQLRSVFGSRAPFIQATVRGEDRQPVAAGEEQSKLKQVFFFAGDSNNKQQVEAALVSLVEDLVSRLRRRRQRARRTGLCLEYSDGRRCWRQATCKEPVDDEDDLLALARLALARTWTRRVRLRSLVLVFDLLTGSARQFSLFPQPGREKRRQLQAALDQIRERHGASGIRRGTSLPVL